MRSLPLTFMFIMSLVFFSHSSFGLEIAVWDHFYKLDSQANTREGVVIPLFKKVGTKFVNFKTEEPAKEFQIAFDGKLRGTVKVKNPGPSEENSEFSTFPKNTKVPAEKFTHPDRKSEAGYRPLVLISGGNATDPDHWKRGSLSPKQTQSLKDGFRKLYPKVSCMRSEYGEDQPKSTKPFVPSDKSIQIDQVYLSTRPAAMARVTFSADCDLEGASERAISLWLAIPTEGPVKKLAEPTQDLKLIDAGDYDGTGHSKFLFVDINSDAEDFEYYGYSLWDENFNRLGAVDWSGNGP